MSEPSLAAKAWYEAIGVQMALDTELAARIAGDAATLASAMAYTDTSLTGRAWKQPVRFKTTANVNLAAGGLAAATTHDGVTAATGDRALVGSQTAPAENGIYIVPASGAPTRATDADSSSELVNATCYVSEGTDNADKQFTCTADAPITVGTTALPWAQSGSGTFDLPGEIHAATGKTTPVDADEFGIADSAASYALKKLTWVNVKAGIFSAWGGLISAATAKTTPIGADAFALMDSAASNATKKVTFTSVIAAIQTIFDTRYTISGTGGGGVDAYFANVTSLLPLDAANGTNTITDVIGKTWTANGGIVFSSTRKRFGAGALFFDGTNDFAETAAHADWNLGTGDFHMRGWMCSRQTTGDYVGLVALNVAASGHFRVGNRVGSAGNFSFNFHDGAAYRDVNSGYNPNDGFFHYWEVLRIAGVFILMIDKRIVAVNDSFTSSNVGNSSNTLRLGYNAANGTYYSGYQQDFRFTKGTPREDYMTALPTTAAPTS